METTVDLPDDLLHAINLRAVIEGRKLKEVVVDLLRVGLKPTSTNGSANGGCVSKDLPRMKVRLVSRSAERALTSQEWCDWLKNEDLQIDADRYAETLGHQHVDRADP